MEIEENRFEKNTFKNPSWHERKKALKQSRNQRLNKNLKQICTNELLSKNKFNCNIFYYLIGSSHRKKT